MLGHIIVMTYTAARGWFYSIIPPPPLPNFWKLISGTFSKTRNRQRRCPPISEIHRAKHPSPPSADRQALRPKVHPRPRGNPSGSIVRSLGHLHHPDTRYRRPNKRPSILRPSSEPIHLLHRLFFQLPPRPRPHISPTRQMPQMAPKIPHEPYC